MKEYKLQQCIDTLHSNNVRFISGKWFNASNMEITKYIEKYIAKTCQLVKVNDIKDVINSYIIVYGDDGDWPELNIVTEARRLGPLGKDTILPFNLDNKQLLIINRLLFHPTDEIMFITTGCGGSGKSTFLNIVKQLFDNDVSSITLDQLSNDFLLTEAVKHRLMASDELNKGDLSMTKLKTLISRQSITGNPKGLTPYNVKTQSKLFYCCNTPPKMDLSDSGILRRIVYYYRNTKIENPDATLQDKKYTHDELLIIARRALAADKYANDWFKFFAQETHDNLLRLNSVYIYYQTMLNDNYEQYREYCKNAGLKAYSEPNYIDIMKLIREWGY